MKKVTVNRLIKNDKINWICIAEKCPQNCCEKKEAVISKESSIFNLDQTNIPLTENDALILEENAGFKNITDLTSDYKFIKCDKDGRCSFFNQKGQCSIYEYRPSSCKAYPFFIDKYLGLYIDLGCPGVREGWTELSKVCEMIDEHEKINELHYSMAKELLTRNQDK